MIFSRIYKTRNVLSPISTPYTPLSANDTSSPIYTPSLSIGKKKSNIAIFIARIFGNKSPNTPLSGVTPNPTVPCLDCLPHLFNAIECHADFGKPGVEGLYRESCRSIDSAQLITGLNQCGSTYLTDTNPRPPMHAMAVVVKRILMAHFSDLRTSLSVEDLQKFEGLDAASKKSFCSDLKLQNPQSATLRALLDHLVIVSEVKSLNMTCNNLGIVFQVAVLAADRMVGCPTQSTPITSTLMASMISCHAIEQDKSAQSSPLIAVPGLVNNQLQSKKNNISLKETDHPSVTTLNSQVDDKKISFRKRVKNLFKSMRWTKGVVRKVKVSLVESSLMKCT